MNDHDTTVPADANGQGNGEIPPCPEPWSLAHYDPKDPLASLGVLGFMSDFGASNQRSTEERAAWSAVFDAGDTLGSVLDVLRSVSPVAFAVAALNMGEHLARAAMAASGADPVVMANYDLGWRLRDNVHAHHSGASDVNGADVG